MRSVVASDPARPACRLASNAAWRSCTSACCRRCSLACSPNAADSGVTPGFGAGFGGSRRIVSALAAFCAAVSAAASAARIASGARGRGRGVATPGIYGGILKSSSARCAWLKDSCPASPLGAYVILLAPSSTDISPPNKRSIPARTAPVAGETAPDAKDNNAPGAPNNS